MLDLMENTCDLKNLSLQLYGKEVEITLRENSCSQKQYNTIILRGTLVGRLWGDKITLQREHEETVIALTIRTGSEEFEIPCKDIQLLKQK